MDLFQAVADPVRRRLVEELARGDRSAGELVDRARGEFGVSQSGTSKHLSVLRQSGVVESRVDGKRRVYRLRPESIDEIADWARRQTDFWTRRFDALAAALDEEPAPTATGGDAP